MKILLRNYAYQQYVWVTAKYKDGHFVVNAEPQEERNVVSVINDNRKNYIQCSSCGKLFRKNDPKFEIHKRNSASPSTCLGCRHLYTENADLVKSKYIMNPDGTFTEKTERNVELVCSNYGMYSHYNINSDQLLIRCKFRQCEYASPEEIHDIFTDMPGVFDDIITMDKLFDVGYKGVYPSYHGNREVLLQSKYEIYANINNLNIIDSFTLFLKDAYWVLFYSKKYNEVFTVDSNGKYVIWDSGLDCQDEIKKDIMKLYN